ncbi:hypothetical protein MMC25_000594 [Agyrium rufum]|nr:hypothetical protein [Agyrium rufum]
MAIIKALTAVAALAASVSARAITSPANSYTPAKRHIPYAQVVYYTTTNTPALDSNVVAIPVLADGYLNENATVLTPLSQGSTTANATLVTQLSSGDFLRVAGDFLFVANAVDNKLAMFAIDPANPTSLTLVGTPVNTMPLPDSVAVSAINQIVCVANTGAPSVIQCATYDSSSGIGELDAERQLFPPQLNVSSDAMYNAVGDIFFSDAEDYLFLTMKGVKGTPFQGYFGAMDVNCGQVNENITMSVINGTHALYQSVQIPGTDTILAADAAYGATSFNLNGTQQANHALFQTLVKGQNASCWVEISQSTTTAFISDPIFGRVTEFDYHNGTIVQEIPLPQDTGALDFSIVGNKIYMLFVGVTSLHPMVGVFDLSGGRGTAYIAQQAQPAAVTGHVIGLSTWPAS